MSTTALIGLWPAQYGTTTILSVTDGADTSTVGTTIVAEREMTTLRGLRRRVAPLLAEIVWIEQTVVMRGGNML